MPAMAVVAAAAGVVAVPMVRTCCQWSPWVAICLRKSGPHRGGGVDFHLSWGVLPYPSFFPDFDGNHALRVPGYPPLLVKHNQESGTQGIQFSLIFPTREYEC